MKKLLSVAVAGAVLGSAGANAQVPDAEWQQFKAQFEAMAKRVEALEAENAQLRGVGTNLVTVEDLAQTQSDIEELKASAKSTSWAQNVRWKGDFRYRYEEIDEDTKDDRERHRIRARAALIADLPSDVEVGLGLATGGDDPVSTNQTLGGGGSTKDIRLDLAYFKWKPNDFYLQAGKYSNPYYKPQKSALIWDGDFRPEGIGAGWASDNFFATLAGGWIESDSRRDDDFFWGLQGGVELFDMLTASIAYHDFPVQGREPVEIDGEKDFFGNSSIGIGDLQVYRYNYEVVNIGLDLGLTLFDMPLNIYGDFIENQDADDLEQGYLAGFKLGKVKKRGSWQVQYQYQDLEADATIGLLTDSDFMGGGTDGKGHKIGAAYGLAEKWALGFTYFDGERGYELGSGNDYKRLMIDTKFKY